MTLNAPARILIALVAGFAIGGLGAEVGGPAISQAADFAEPVGRMWLAGLQMTIVPLVVSLLVIGIADSAAAAKASRHAFRSIALFITILWLSSALAALTIPLLLDIYPLPAASAEALRMALSAAPAVGEVPGFAEFLGSIVPTNPISAAANDAILPLIVFTTVFAFALTRIPEEPRERLVGFFRAVADVMLVVINWILLLGPIGVFALAFVVGARTGNAALGALLHYVVVVSAVGVIVWLLAYPLAVFGGQLPLGRFTRAVAPAQAVALSTQSSLASLPEMLRASERLGVPVAASGVTLPLAVALFRATGPAMNLAVALYVAHWFGVQLGPAQIGAGIAAAAITTMGAVSLPGQVSFVTSIAPISLAMGVPIEALAILIAVETIPDLFRTLGNVTMDVAVTATVARRSGFDEAEASAADRLLREGAD